MLLSLAGELADTTLFAASAGVEYFRFGRERVEKGLAKARETKNRDLEGHCQELIAAAKKAM